MNNVKYIVGSAAYPIGPGLKIITHICNNGGGWGKGFVLAVSQRWSLPEKYYRYWHQNIGFKLGDVQFCQVESDIVIANMVAQHRYQPTQDSIPLRYAALEECLRIVSFRAIETGASIHMPRIGCGLAGGVWFKEPFSDTHTEDLDLQYPVSSVLPFVEEELANRDILVYVYDLTEEDKLKHNMRK